VVIAAFMLVIAVFNSDPNVPKAEASGALKASSAVLKAPAPGVTVLD